jgi:hypothetical protein
LTTTTVFFAAIRDNDKCRTVIYKELLYPMSVKYHVNPVTGRPNKCNAIKKACKYSPVGEPERHWETIELARVGYTALLPDNPTFAPFDDSQIKKRSSSSGVKSIYAQTEEHVADLFDPTKHAEPVSIQFKGDTWTAVLSAKPVAIGGGEGKSDVYIVLQNEAGEREEVKISIKQSNADYIENKLSMRRAQEIFGDDFKTVMKPYLDIIADKAEEHHDPVTEEHITLGLRIDIENKGLRKMCTEMTDISRDAKIEIYAGNRLTEKKLHSKVNGEVIENSGAANYILHGDMPDFTSAQVIVDKMVHIEDYVDDPNSPKLYMSAGAVNFRKEGKFDSARPLGVRMRYTVDPATGEVNGHTFDRNNPLEVNSTQAAAELPDFIKSKYITNRL